MKRLSMAMILVFALPLAAGDGKHCDMKKQGEHHAVAAGEKHGEHGKSCDMKAAEGTAVEMDGTLLCMSCDLKKADKCQKVFQTASDSSKLLPICHSSKVDVEALHEHGGTKMHVTGKLVKCAEDGKEELLIETASKI